MPRSAYDDWRYHFRKWREVAWEWIKPVLQAFGIFWLWVIYLFYIRKAPTDFEGILTFIIPLVYIAIRWYFLLPHHKSSAKSTPVKSAQEWRDDFDHSPACQRYLALIKKYRPKWIYLMHTEPPPFPLADQQPLYNRLYPPKTPSAPTFFAHIRMEDDKGNVFFKEKWPSFPKCHNKESMDYFYDWLCYHLPDNLTYGRREKTSSPSSGLSQSSYYTISENLRGDYVVYPGDWDSDTKDPPAQHLGYILYRKS